MSIVYRQELGRELTWSEADNNFAELKAGVDSKKSNFDILSVTQGGTGQTSVDAVKVAFDIATKTELASSDAGKGAELVALDDGAGGSLWTTVKGFIAYLMSSLGASIVGFIQALTGARARSVQDKLRDTLSILDFTGVDPSGATDSSAGLLAAILASDNSGKPLVWDEGDYLVSTPIAASVSRLNWIGKGARINFNPSGDQAYGVDITCAVGADHMLSGTGLSINFNGKAHRGIRFNQPIGDQTATISISKLAARNVEMQVGAGIGSAGIAVTGGWKKVTLVDPVVKEVKMRVGAGVETLRGVTGILVLSGFGVAGAYAKRTEIIRPTVDHVYAADPNYQFDMDGIGVFANPDIDNSNGPSSLRVVSPNISRCWGRDIKTQVASAVIENPSSLRSEGPAAGLKFPAYDFQTGPGLLIGGEYVIDGVVDNGGICRFSCGTATAPMVSQWIGGAVTVVNSADVKAVARHDPITGPKKALSVFSGQQVRGAVREFALIRTNGFDLDTAKLNGVIVETLTDALVRVETRTGGAYPYRAVITAVDCANLGASMPLVRGNIVGLSAQHRISQERCDGFSDSSALNSSTSATASGVEIVGPRVPVPYQSGLGFSLSGSERDFALVLTAGQELTLPEHGFNGNYLAFITMSFNQTTYALLSVGSAIVTISAGAGANIGTTADPGSGDLRVWRSGSQLVIKNGNASQRVVMVKYFG